MFTVQYKKGGGFPDGARDKELDCQFRRHRTRGFHPWVQKIPWRRAWQPIPVFMSEESHGQKRWVGYGPYIHKESNMTEVT